MFITNALEEVALAKPGMLRQIHGDYLDAGAQILQTHTFAANRSKLARYDLADKVEAINRRAAEIALKVAGDKAWGRGRHRSDGHHAGGGRRQGPRRDLRHVPRPG